MLFVFEVLTEVFEPAVAHAATARCNAWLRSEWSGERSLSLNISPASASLQHNRGAGALRYINAAFVLACCPSCSVDGLQRSLLNAVEQFRQEVFGPNWHERYALWSLASSQLRQLQQWQLDRNGLRISNFKHW